MNTQQNTYTFHINTERMNPSYTVEEVHAKSMEAAWSAVELAYPCKGITLKSVNGVPYVHIEDSAESASTWADSEERYWAAAITCAERFC